MGDAAHTGRSENRGPSMKPSPAWTYQTGARVFCIQEQYLPKFRDALPQGCALVLPGEAGVKRAAGLRAVACEPSA